MSASPAPEPTRRRTVAGFFLRGLAALLPIALTAFVFVTVIRFANDYVTRPINQLIYWSLESNALGWEALSALGVHPLEPDRLDVDSLPIQMRDLGQRRGFASPEFLEELRKQRSAHDGFWKDLSALHVDAEELRAQVQDHVHPLIGVVISLVLLLWLGWMMNSIVGRFLVARLEGALFSLPGVRSVYPYAKQLVEFFLSADKRKKLEFQSVVAIPYPSDGLWSYGFVTNRAVKSLCEATGKPLVSVFVPSTPLPMSGFTVSIEESRVVHLPLSVDDALKVIVSGGVMLPPSEIDTRARGSRAIAAPKP